MLLSINLRNCCVPSHLVWARVVVDRSARFTEESFLTHPRQEPNNDPSSAAAENHNGIIKKVTIARKTHLFFVTSRKQREKVGFTP